MPKRICPFENGFLPQSKFHLTDKVYNSTTSQMNYVYDRTMSLLYQGAKSLIRDTEQTSTHHQQPVVNDKKRYKQLFLDSACRLQQSGTEAATGSTTSCQCCEYDNINASQLCTACCRLACVDCLRVCVRCHADVCLRCLSDLASVQVCKDCS